MANPTICTVGELLSIIHHIIELFPYSSMMILHVGMGVGRGGGVFGGSDDLPYFFEANLVHLISLRLSSYPPGTGQSYFSKILQK